jgi:hypothetical protein
MMTCDDSSHWCRQVCGSSVQEEGLGGHHQGVLIGDDSHDIVFVALEP